jgi:hypothetical protein
MILVICYEKSSRLFRKKVKLLRKFLTNNGKRKQSIGIQSLILIYSLVIIESSIRLKIDQKLIDSYQNLVI